MPFPYNSSGINTEGGFKPIPDGDYTLRITAATPGVTNNGDNKVTVDYEIADGDLKGETIKYHTLTFFRDKASKGASIAVKFLKAIGEPWEGDFTVDENAWIGKKVMGTVTNELQTDGKNKGKRFPKVKWVNEIPGANLPEDVPF